MIAIASFEHCTVVYRSSHTLLIQTICQQLTQQANVEFLPITSTIKCIKMNLKISDIHYGTQTLMINIIINVLSIIQDTAVLQAQYNYKLEAESWNIT